MFCLPIEITSLPAQLCCDNTDSGPLLIPLICLPIDRHLEDVMGQLVSPQSSSPPSTSEGDLIWKQMSLLRCSWTGSEAPPVCRVDSPSCKDTLTGPAPPVIQLISTLTLISEVKVAQSCPTLCDPMDFTVHGILQARILEWAAFPFSRGSSQPRD